MSRTSQSSNDNKVSNPSKCYLDWSAGDGQFTYWNGKESVPVKELSFALIDTVKSVTGWDSKSNSRIYSNSVKSVNDKFIVREQKTGSVLAEGTYQEIKSDRWSLTENVLAMAEIDGEVGIVQVSFSKSALNAFIEFRTENKMNDLYRNMITVKSSEEQKNGRVTYYLPEFSLSDLDSELSLKADEADLEYVKPYITYLKETFKLEQKEEVEA